MYFAKKKKKKGFTLIELLVVIAIIGILATIVIINVNNARTKAKDAAIIGSMDTVRTAAEMAYNDSGPQSYASTCLSTTFGSTGDFARISAGVTAQGSTVKCNAASATPGSYVAWASTSAGAYCVDSTGNAKSEPSTWASPSGSTYTCP